MDNLIVVTIIGFGIVAVLLYEISGEIEKLGKRFNDSSSDQTVIQCLGEIREILHDGLGKMLNDSNSDETVAETLAQPINEIRAILNDEFSLDQKSVLSFRYDILRGLSSIEHAVKEGLADLERTIRRSS